MKTKYIERLVSEHCPVLGSNFYLKKYRVFNKGSKFINKDNRQIVYKNK